TAPDGSNAELVLRACCQPCYAVCHDVADLAGLDDLLGVRSGRPVERRRAAADCVLRDAAVTVRHRRPPQGDRRLPTIHDGEIRHAARVGRRILRIGNLDARRVRSAPRCCCCDQHSPCCPRDESSHRVHRGNGWVGRCPFYFCVPDHCTLRIARNCLQSHGITDFDLTLRYGDGDLALRDL